MNLERLRELAALQALGVLDEAGAQELQRLRSEDNRLAQGEVAAFQDVTAALARALPQHLPPASLKSKVLARLERPTADEALWDNLEKLLPPLAGGFAFERGAEATGWQSLPVAGAYFKLLSLDRERQVAVALGKLDPGAHYPGHRHIGPEDVYMLSGDLHIGDHVLHAGDHHHAAAGSTHPVNRSEHGCTLLIVLSTQDLAAQLQAETRS